MPTKAPCDEACQAIVSRINSAITYILPEPAAYTQRAIDALEDVNGFRVDVVHETAQQLQQSLDPEEPTSHIVRVWVRDKLNKMDSATVESRNLLFHKIYQRCNEFTSADRRVSVWDCGKDRGEIPGKWSLVEKFLYRAYFDMRVEVELS